MTWSVTAIGKAEAVKTKVAADFEKINVHKPEGEVVSRIGEAIVKALASLPDDCPVKVSASGSGYHPDPDERGFLQSFTVNFEPMYGWIE